MRKIFSSLLILVIFSACGKETFYDKFVPEILYYQNADVENADFKEITLARGVTQYAVKARVSAPMKLKDIQILRATSGQSEQLLQTYSDFQLVPNVYKVNYAVTGISTQTTIRIVATDQEGKTTSRNFTIRVTQ